MRELPHNQEAEKALLAWILLDPDTALKCTQQSNLKQTDFYSASHRLIFEQMLQVKSGEGKLDLFTLVDSLRSVGLLEKVGGVAYLCSICDSDSLVTTEADIQFICQIILHHSWKRELMRGDAKATD